MLATIKRLVYSKNVLYSAAIYLLVVWAIGHLFWRGIHHAPYLRRWHERFGFVKPVISDDVIWVHAVSVGEVRTVSRLVEFLKNEYPDSQILITTMTPTGSAQVRQTHGDSVLHCFAPYDLPGSVRRFLDRVRPRLAFVIETEFWPNILRMCEERSIPTLLLNVRVSPKSFRGYALFPRFMRGMLGRPSVMAAQSEDDASRLLALGACAERVVVTGNLKFDVSPPRALSETAMELRNRWGKSRPVWIAASTHDGEEKKVLEAFRVLRKSHPDTLLVVVPRHPERFANVAKICRRSGYKVALHSETRKGLAETDILVGDTMGELAGMYGAADVAFVGGSLVRHGGHNLVEAMAVGTPVVFGPHVFNFEQSSRTALNYGAAEQVQDPGELAATVQKYLDDPELRDRAADAAKRVIEDSRGSLQATEALIRETVKRARPPEQPESRVQPAAARGSLL
ncbi:MAG: lipid IV(A) 3-deoxy-D-manno-octulosonic acid transferase [Gammaproteobacteria bacterium]|nr:lipid IV(A) 3-deoxy-D-manno-octulosonic acid transferase [Gammaproteobacteria bacterium]